MQKTLLKQIFDELFINGKVKNQFEFGEKLEYSSGYVTTAMRADDIPHKMQKKLHEVFGISMKYMQSNGSKGTMFTEEPPATTKPQKRIPVLGEAVAGTDMMMTYNDTQNEVEYIDVGDLLRDSEAAFTVYGNSMTPSYPSGCVLGIRPCYDSFIQPGEIYLIVTKSNKVFKRLYYNDDRTGYICHSDNTMMHETGPRKGKYFYEPFEVMIVDVLRIFDVIGMIKRTRNSNIIQHQK